MAGTNCLFFSLRQAFYVIHVTSETFSKDGPGQNKSFNMHCWCSYKGNKTTDHSIGLIGLGMQVFGPLAPGRGPNASSTSRTGRACATSSLK